MGERSRLAETAYLNLSRRLSFGADAGSAKIWEVKLIAFLAHARIKRRRTETRLGEGTRQARLCLFEYAHWICHGNGAWRRAVLMTSNLVLEPVVSGRTLIIVCVGFCNSALQFCNTASSKVRSWREPKLSVISSPAVGCSAFALAECLLSRDLLSARELGST